MSTHNICYLWEIRILFTWYPLLSRLWKWIQFSPLLFHVQDATCMSLTTLKAYIKKALERPHMYYACVHSATSPQQPTTGTARINCCREVAVVWRDRYIMWSSRKHAYIILTPLKPQFYIVKLEFTGVYVIFLILQKNRLWVLFRTASPRRFLRLPTIYVLSRNVKNIRIFYLKMFLLLMAKFSIYMYLNRRLFVMVIALLWHFYSNFIFFEESQWNRDWSFVQLHVLYFQRQAL